MSNGRLNLKSVSQLSSTEYWLSTQYWHTEHTCIQTYRMNAMSYILLSFLLELTDKRLRQDVGSDGLHPAWMNIQWAAVIGCEHCDARRRYAVRDMQRRGRGQFARRSNYQSVSSIWYQADTPSVVIYRRVEGLLTTALSALWQLELSSTRIFIALLWRPHWAGVSCSLSVCSCLAYKTSILILYVYNVYMYTCISEETHWLIELIVYVIQLSRVV